MASHFIVPHLPGFLAEYPGVELFISEGDRYVDLVRDGVDCAIRVGRLPDSDLITRRLTTLEETTCASPSYLARHGIPQDLDALDGHRMVGFHSSATGSVLPLEFISNGVARTVILPASVTVSGAETYAAAARMGLGLIQAPRYRLEEDFRRGTLSPVLTDTPPSPSPVSVLYPRAKQLSPRLRAFLNWLFTRIRNETAAE